MSVFLPLLSYNNDYNNIFDVMWSWMMKNESNYIFYHLIFAFYHHSTVFVVIYFRLMFYTRTYNFQGLTNLLTTPLQQQISKEKKIFFLYFNFLWKYQKFKEVMLESWKHSKMAEKIRFRLYWSLSCFFLLSLS